MKAVSGLAAATVSSAGSRPKQCAEPLACRRHPSGPIKTPRPRRSAVGFCVARAPRSDDVPASTRLPWSPAGVRPSPKGVRPLLRLMKVAPPKLKRASPSSTWATVRRRPLRSVIIHAFDPSAKRTSKTGRSPSQLARAIGMVWLSPLIAGEASPRSTGVAGPARPKSQKRPASKRPPTGREKAINRSERGDHESRCDVKS